MKLLRALLPVLVFGIMALMPQQAAAATATFFGPIFPEECHCDAAHNNGVESAPDFGCVLQTIENLMNFAISIGVIIFVLVAAYAGLLFMFSSTNPHNKETARNVLINAVVGLLIALSAWLLVDFIMKTIYNERFGPWYSILGEGQQCLTVITPPAGGGGGTVTPPVEPAQCDRPDDHTVAVGGCCAGNENACSTGFCNSTSKVCETVVGGGAHGGVTDWGAFFGFQSGISAQKDNASGALSTMLGCMASNLNSNGHTNVSQISSISDSRIENNTKTWAQCRNGECAHCGGTGSNSCAGGGGASYHYGGTHCGDSSYAVDFSADPGTSAATLLTQAAQQCGATKIIPEGSPAHIHIQVGSCN